MSEWISVKDRLPENRTEVLVKNIRGITIAIYFGSTTCSGHFSGRQGRSHILSTVTHWMPLPEPPEGL